MNSSVVLARPVSRGFRSGLHVESYRKARIYAIDIRENISAQRRPSSCRAINYRYLEAATHSATTNIYIIAKINPKYPTSSYRTYNTFHFFPNPAHHYNPTHHGQHAMARRIAFPRPLHSVADKTSYPPKPAEHDKRSANKE